MKRFRIALSGREMLIIGTALYTLHTAIGEGQVLEIKEITAGRWPQYPDLTSPLMQEEVYCLIQRIVSGGLRPC